MAHFQTAGTITDANNSLNVHMGVFILAYCEQNLKKKKGNYPFTVMHCYCI